MKNRHDVEYHGRMAGTQAFTGKKLSKLMLSSPMCRIYASEPSKDDDDDDDDEEEKQEKK